MHKSTVERRIAETSDFEELNRIGLQYANGGNYATALLA